MIGLEDRWNVKSGVPCGKTSQDSARWDHHFQQDFAEIFQPDPTRAPRLIPQDEPVSTTGISDGTLTVARLDRWYYSLAPELLNHLSPLNSFTAQVCDGHNGAEFAEGGRVVRVNAAQEIHPAQAL